MPTTTSEIISSNPLYKNLGLDAQEQEIIEPATIPIPTMNTKELLDAQTHLWNLLFGFMNSYSMKSAIELGIPDAIHNHGKPITLTDLASTLSIPSCRIPNLQRFMRLLVHNGLFAQATSENVDEDIYALTPNSTLLVKEKTESIKPFIEFIMQESVLVPWQSLTEWFKSEKPSSAFEMYHGVKYWEGTAKMPELGKWTREGLESDSAVVAKVIIEDCPDQFEGVKTLVEVAGVTGKIAKAITKAFPGIKCTLFELPHVIDAIEKSDEIEYVAGDMFEKIPSADVLILKWVLMAWTDEECVEILKRCKEAIPSKENGGKLILIEKVPDATTDYGHPKQTETQIYWDMQMMVHLGAKLRRENEFKKIFNESGFNEYKIIPALGTRCIIELYH